VFALANSRKEPVNPVTGNQNPVQQTDQSAVQVTSDVTLFYGDGCPHCALVEEYVSQNGIEAKIPFTKKEVYYNRQNADELVAKAKICGYPTDSIGVPFLWDGSKCLVGDRDIIEFFKSKSKDQ
jgi:glutaredoxin